MRYFDIGLVLLGAPPFINQVAWPNGQYPNILISQFLNLAVQAIERPHFFAQPIDIPFVFGEKDTLGLTGGFSAEVGNGQSGGFVPDAAEFTDMRYCHDKIVFVRKSEWVKQLITRVLTRFQPNKFYVSKVFLVKISERCKSVRSDVRWMPCFAKS